MNETNNSKLGMGILSVLAVAVFLYHMLTTITAGYGYFIDEFYYIACARRLAFGYVDHPPLSIALLAANRALLGDSIPALRFLPALAGAGTVFMTGLIARRLGGSAMAMALAAVSTAAMPVYLLMSSFYSMNAFEPLIWASVVYFTIRMIGERQPLYWLVIGLLAGVGLEMKHTIVIYFVALGIGMLATPARQLLWNRWFALGVAIAGLILLPNLVWQYVHGFPSLEFYRNAMIKKNIPTAPASVLVAQVLFANPIAAPLWIAGLIFLLFSRRAADFRFFGVAYLVLVGMMIASKSSRPDRIAAIYSLLFAAGAVAVDGLKSRRWVSVALIVAIGVGGVIAAPMFTPLLPPQRARSYLEAIGLSLSIENGKRGDPLPQWLGDRIGWKELAADTARVYNSLPPQEQRGAIIMCSSYGTAGALELYGRELGLPPVYCTHNNYHMWGPPADTAGPFIGVSVNGRDWEKRFQSVSEAAIHTCELATRPQRKIPIYVARRPNFSITAVWPSVKEYQ